MPSNNEGSWQTHHRNGWLLSDTKSLPSRNLSRLRKGPMGWLRCIGEEDGEEDGDEGGDEGGDWPTDWTHVQRRRAYTHHRRSSLCVTSASTILPFKCICSFQTSGKHHLRLALCSQQWPQNGPVNSMLSTELPTNQGSRMAITTAE